MRKALKIFFNFVVIFFLFSCTNISFAQISQIITRLSSGNDRNPSFRIRDDGFNISSIPWEFLIYERVNGNSSNILVSKIGVSGALDSGTYLTNNSYANLNPTIGYYFLPNSTNEILNALAVWETNKNGNKDIYARIYKQGQGWLPEFAIDNMSGDQINPKTALFYGNIYAVVYQSGNDIKLKFINTDNQSILSDTNLTSGINEPCKNPRVIITQGNVQVLYITYEREFSSNQNSVYCMKSILPEPLNFMIDTVRYSGVNYNAGFSPMFQYLYLYESYKNGKRNIYGTQIKWNGQSSVSYDVLTSQYFDFWGYSGSNFILGKNIVDNIHAFITKQDNSLYVKIKNNWFTEDSLSKLISFDTNYKSNTSFSTGQNILNNECYQYWIVFGMNLNSPGKGIYGATFTSCAMDINNLSGEIPSSYSLSQNYPNPFNNETVIKFAIPKNGITTLKVFDILGNEVATLLNEYVNAGSYKINFNADKYYLSSGIYFYSIKTPEYTETKKLIYLK